MSTAIRNMPPWIALLFFMLFSNQMIDANERFQNPSKYFNAPLISMRSSY